MSKIYISLEIDINKKNTISDSVDTSKTIERNIVKTIHENVENAIVNVKENYIV